MKKKLNYFRTFEFGKEREREETNFELKFTLCRKIVLDATFLATVGSIFLCKLISSQRQNSKFKKKEPPIFTQ